MATRRIYDCEGHAQFVTFSCYGRRRLLNHPRARQIVIGVLGEELRKRHGQCCGFVIMPNHVHATVRFPEDGCISGFMQVWKGRSARKLKAFVRGHLSEYTKSINVKEPFWQAKYYAFNLYSEEKAREKLEYMHLNPVRAGLVSQAIDWRWSSARHFELGEPVGLPLSWIFED